MKIIALYSIKGGVGKTSSAVNLAFIAASKGYRTLIWDLDPQGASSYYFRIKPRLKGGSKDLIAGKRELDGLIKGTDFENLDLLPSDFSFRNMDLVLDTKKSSSGTHLGLMIIFTYNIDSDLSFYLFRYFFIIINSHQILQ